MEVRLTVRRALLAGVAAAAATGLISGVAMAESPDTAAQVNHYVALGDSYTAGPLIPWLPLDPGGCAKSTNNYPSLLAAKLKPKKFTDASCSAADTTNMTKPQHTFLGTNAPQFNALTKDTDLVTIGIGGNDFGVFGSLINTCPALR